MPSDLKLASAGDRAGADLTWRQCLTRVGSFSAHAGRLWPGRDGGTVPASPWELGAQALAAARPRAIALMTAPVSGRRLSSSVAVRSRAIYCLEDRGGTGRTALVVGCGFGDDAEAVASLGFSVVAFDISPTAIDGARSRFPGSSVDYTPGDLLNPPASWRGAFDLVVEIYTVQPLHGTARTTALSMLPRLVAPGGTLLIIAHATEQSAPKRDPASFPWPLTRAEIDSATGLLHPVTIELLRNDENPPTLRWRAEFNRPLSAQ